MTQHAGFLQAVRLPLDTAFGVFWRCRTGRPRWAWLRTVEDDLHLLNFGLATARRRALDRRRSAWQQLMEAAPSTW